MYLAPHFFQLQIFQMANIWRKYLITFTFNVYFGWLWHDRNRSQRLEKIELSILTSSFAQDFLSVASFDDLFQIVNIRHLIIENHLIYSCFMMQHRINCPRTARAFRWIFSKLTRATKLELVCFISWLHFSIDPSIRTPRATPTSPWAHLIWKTWNWNCIKWQIFGPTITKQWQ